MMPDLLSKHVLLGASYADILDLLGPMSPIHEYLLGDDGERMFALQLAFDRDDRVSGYRSHLGREGVFCELAYPAQCRRMARALVRGSYSDLVAQLREGETLIMFYELGIGVDAMRLDVDYVASADTISMIESLWRILEFRAIK